MFWADTFESAEALGLFLGLFKSNSARTLKRSPKGVKDLRLPEDRPIEPQLTLIPFSMSVPIHPRTKVAETGTNPASLEAAKPIRTFLESLYNFFFTNIDPLPILQIRFSRTENS